MEERAITVQRTARYHTLGDAATAKEIWMVLHGYGHLARFFLNGFEGLEEGRFIVAPEALSRYYTDATYGRVGASWMTREDREHEIEDQIIYLDALTEQVRRQCPMSKKLGGLGFSQGVPTVCRWTMTGRTAIDHLVIWSGSMPPELDPKAMKERWGRARIDLVHGLEDEQVKEEVMEQNEGRLRGAGLDFRAHRFQGGHELEGVLLDRLLNDRSAITA